MARITGRCLCGSVRFEYDGEVGPAGICHCADCRHVTGSAFNVGVRLEAKDFHVVKGVPRGFTKRADSGNDLTRYFCPDCGSPLYGSSPAHPDFIYARAGSLDDPGVVHLSHQSWTSSAVDWAIIPPDLPAFEKGRT
jgi:hypothetical protein